MVDQWLEDGDKAVIASKTGDVFCCAETFPVGRFECPCKD